MPKPLLLLSLALAVVASACDRPSEQKAGEAPTATATADARTAAPPAATVMTVPTDLPPFGAKATDRRLAAQLVDSVGMHETGAREYGELPGVKLGRGGGELPPPWNDLEPGRADNDVKMLIAAVKADPGSATARVALAEHVRDDAFRVAQLTPLATASAATCPDCADELLSISFADDSPALQALLATVKPSRARRLAELVTKYLATGDEKAVKAMFGGKVTYLVECSNCDEPSRPRTVTGAKVMAEIAETIEASAGEIDPGTTPYVTPHWLRCHAHCCATYTTMLGHAWMYFKAVCFAPDADRVTSLTITAG